MNISPAPSKESLTLMFQEIAMAVVGEALDSPELVVGFFIVYFF